MLHATGTTLSFQLSHRVLFDVGIPVAMPDNLHDTLQQFGQNFNEHATVLATAVEPAGNIYSGKHAWIPICFLSYALGTNSLMPTILMFY